MEREGCEQEPATRERSNECTTIEIETTCKQTDG